MATTRETLLDWLRDAHALEEAEITALSNHAKSAEEYPQLKAKLEQHLETTRRHSAEVRECINRLGGDSSGTKDVIGKTTTFLQGLVAGASGDTVVKNCLNDYAAEHMEIASYKSLIAAADELGERPVADTCRRILRDEEEMASWLENSIPTVTHEYLMHSSRQG